jgi:hypothetical protein
MQPRSDDELKKLARDIHAGYVFSDRDIPYPKGIGPDETWVADVRMVFMPLALADQEHLDQLQALDVRLIYEYLDKAGPRSINGYPSFMSMNIVTGEEWPRLSTYLRALDEAPDPLAQV